MALIFDSTINRMALYRGIFKGLSLPTAITVYKGTQPSAASIVSGWTNFNTASADCLAHYTGANWVQQPVNAPFINVNNTPTAAPAYKSGEATWAILWITNITTGSIASNTLPSTSFIVVPCSNTTGKGVVRFIDPVFVSGTANPINEVVIKTA